MLDVRRCTVAEIEQAPNIEGVLIEYGAECAIEGMGAPHAQFEQYKQYEAAGALHVVGAFDGEYVVGVLAFLLPKLPHYGRLAAVSESFFVTTLARKTGAGLRLRAAAEEWAFELGASGLFISAPIDGPLAKVLEADKGYEETNRVFFKRFKR